MLPFKNILFPVDYSAACDAVVPYVDEMVQRFSANLALVHAYGEVFAFEGLNDAYEELIDRGRDSEKKELQEFAAQSFPGRHVDTFVECGDPAATIRKIVDHQGADLVMMPTHGRGVIRRFLLGSVAAKTLHDISAAVWTGAGRAFENHRPHMPYQSIMCCFDGSEEAEAVLRAAESLACAYRARLSIVQVAEAPAAASEIDITPYLEEMIEAADSKLCETKSRLGIEAPHSIVYGTLIETLREEAIQRNADLIVAGRGHDQQAFGRIWSCLYPLVRESPCPVLSI
jgi:nucleotide-binding universal stress UspA family protein